MPEEVFDALIVGGGAAGMFAAINCKANHPSLNVTVLEKAPRFLTKVGISGGGRCYVTHACFEPSELVKHYPRGSRELRGPFHSWQPRDTVDWFESRGVKIKQERDGRKFPTTDDSQTIIDCLLNEARRLDVTLENKCGVKGIDFNDTTGVFLVDSSRGDFRTRRLMLATGSLKAGALSESIEALGHTVASLAPSLFTFNIKDARLQDLQGIAVAPATVSICGEKYTNTGPVLITHWGLSGPAILKTSAVAARRLQELKYHFDVSINWLPEISQSGIDEALNAARKDRARQRVIGYPLFCLPRRLWESLCQAAGISPEVQWGQVPGLATQRLIRELQECRFSVRGKSMNKEEFVTCGGVSLKEVNFKRMESRIQAGLFFGGEVLDIDGVTGGFNLQAAWTAGYIAGRAMAD